MLRRFLGQALLVTAWLMPGAATAGTFVWTVDANGAWTDTTKWTYQPGSGNAGIGYPTNPGDVAILGDETTVFCGPRTITIPNNVHITVGVIGMKSTVGFTVVTGGVVETTGDGQLRLEGDITATSNAAGPAVLRRSDTNALGTPLP
jgi:hypothetical protein